MGDFCFVSAKSTGNGICLIFTNTPNSDIPMNLCSSMGPVKK